jgi:hypothetical protein
MEQGGAIVNLDFDETITLHLDFTVLTLIVMLLFALIARRRGWRAGLTTLSGLFLAWGLALQTTNFMIRAVYFFTGYDFSGDLAGFFTLGLYVSSAIMVVYTFSSIIGPATTDQRDKVTALLVGLLNGYFFMFFLLDLTRDWLATHVNNWTLTVYTGYAFDIDPGRITIITEFTNNAVQVYGQLSQVRNIVLLFLLIVFWHGFLFGLLTGVDKRLKVARK